MYCLPVNVYCTALYYAVLYCTVLYCTVLYCTVLCCTVLYCTVLLPPAVNPIAVDKYQYIIHHTSNVGRLLWSPDRLLLPTLISQTLTVSRSVTYNTSNAASDSCQQPLRSTCQIYVVYLYLSCFFITAVLWRVAHSDLWTAWLVTHKYVYVLKPVWKFCHIELYFSSYNVNTSTLI
jgi:hypothetical protein